MSFKNAIKQMKKLEQEGFLEKGDSSMRKYDECIKIYRRCFPETIIGESYRYLKEKIKDFLIQEKVLFQFHYRGILIFPPAGISKAINKSRSYSEMYQTVNHIISGIPIISIEKCNDKEGLVMLTDSTYLEGDKIEYIINDHIEMSIEPYNTSSYSRFDTKICIKSSLCNDIEEERKRIDKLFE